MASVCTDTLQTYATELYTLWTTSNGTLDCVATMLYPGLARHSGQPALAEIVLWRVFGVACFFHSIVAAKSLVRVLLVSLCLVLLAVARDVLVLGSQGFTN